MFKQASIRPGPYCIAAFYESIYLSVSGPKSKLMCLHVANRPWHLSETFCMCGSPIPMVTECKYLGVLFDQFLSPDQHIKHAAAKTKKVIGWLHSYFKSCPTVFETLYKSKAQPILLYALPVCCPSTVYGPMRTFPPPVRETNFSRISLLFLFLKVFQTSFMF